MEEVWKDIDESGCYQVSNFGNIRSVDHWVTCYCSNGTEHDRLYIGKQLKVFIDADGYRTHSRFGRIARVVAKAFIPNPNNLPCVNHKDENKSNDCADNLEWCTYSYNNTYGKRIEKVRAKELGKFVSEETKKKISEAQKGSKSHNFGKKFSEDHKNKISAANKGRKFSDEHKQKLREAAINQHKRMRGEL